MSSPAPHIGVIATHRNLGAGDSAANSLYGVDGNFAPTEHLRFNTFYMATREPDAPSGHRAASYLGQLRYDTDLIGVSAERLYLGDDFNPRDGIHPPAELHQERRQLQAGARPRSIRQIRQFEFQLQANGYDRPDGETETRNTRWKRENDLRERRPLRHGPHPHRGKPARRLSPLLPGLMFRRANTASPAPGCVSGSVRTGRSRGISATSSGTSSAARAAAS